MLTGSRLSNRGQAGIRINMARSGTIAQLGHGVVGGGSLRFLVLTRVVVTRMTRGAIRCKRR